MTGRRISEREVEEAWTDRHVMSQEPGEARRSGDVLIIRSTLRSGRRLKVIVAADDERFVITVADQDEEDQ